MKTFSAQELEDRLLDYLYDELDADEKAAFEAALPSHPAIVAEVEAHRGTRLTMSALPRTISGPALPDGGLAALLAEADAYAAIVASQPIVAASPAKAPTPSDATPRKAEQQTSGGGFLARIGRALHAALMTPAFATAAVALLVTGVAVVMARRGDMPGADRSAEGQQISAVAPVEVAPSMAPAPPPVAPSPAAAEAEPATAVAANMDTPATGQPADESEELKWAPAPDAPKAAASPIVAAKVAKVAESKKAPVSLAGDAAPKASGGKGRDGSADGKLLDEPTTWGAAEGRAGVYGGDADKEFAVAPPSQPRGYSAPSNVVDSYAQHAAEQAPTEPRKSEVAEKPAPVHEEVVRTGTADQADDNMGGGVPAPARQASRTAPSAPVRREETQLESERAAQTDTQRLAKTDSANKDTTATQVANLWSRYDRQLATGDLVGAEKTLKELETLGADTTRVRTARSRIAAERARRAPADVKPATQSK